MRNKGFTVIFIFAMLSAAFGLISFLLTVADFYVKYKGGFSETLSIFSQSQKIPECKPIKCGSDLHYGYYQNGCKYPTVEIGNCILKRFVNFQWLING